MAQTQLVGESNTANRPQILELLSELQKRDKDSKGKIQSGSVAGAGLTDPRGFTVLNTTGHDVGKVDDLYVDPNTREPHFALLSLGNGPLGIGDRHVLVAFSDLEVTSDDQVHIRVAVS